MKVHDDHFHGELHRVADDRSATFAPKGKVPFVDERNGKHRENYRERKKDKAGMGRNDAKGETKRSLAQSLFLMLCFAGIGRCRKRNRTAEKSATKWKRDERRDGTTKRRKGKKR